MHLSQFSKEGALRILEEWEAKYRAAQQRQGEFSLHRRREHPQEFRINGCQPLAVQVMSQIALYPTLQVLRHAPAGHEAHYVCNLTLDLVIEDLAGDVRAGRHHATKGCRAHAHDRNCIELRSRALGHDVSIADGREGHDDPIEVCHVEVPPRCCRSRESLLILYKPPTTCCDMRQEDIHNKDLCWQKSTKTILCLQPSNSGDDL
mmetsp:Transcript_99395/g.186710  ORF Transcript_99395/g.186710 Transcript_99395/m.186710 type:complete len:205 (+) Transcript_99395:656-1270(+)